MGNIKQAFKPVTQIIFELFGISLFADKHFKM